MKKTILFLQAAVVGLLAACNQPSDEEQLRDEIQYVNPFIGNGLSRAYLSRCYPSVCSCTGQPRHTYHGLGCQ